MGLPRQLLCFAATHLDPVLLVGKGLQEAANFVMVEVKGIRFNQESLLPSAYLIRKVTTGLPNTFMRGDNHERPHHPSSLR
jgi:hypothetical protein